MDEASTRKKPRRAAVKKAARAKRAKAEKAVECAAVGAEKVSPLDFMLMVMRDEAKPAALRLSAARAAAPYLHGRHAGEEPEGGESRLRESLAALVDQVQKQGGGVAALVKRH